MMISPHCFILPSMKRSYEVLLRHHFDSDTQMAFVCGPRQVGKTTTCQSCEPNQMYLNWDHEDHRRKILSGPAAVAADLGLAPHNAVVFDQIHKYPDWRNFIKGFFDVYGRSRLRIVVTGSAHLDVVRKGADSLLGRYFPYRMHPLSIGEIANSTWRDRPIGSPSPISDADYEALLRFGGFPDPFLKRNQRFHNRWTRMRQQLLFREDLR
ncbi:MAG: AAA family ATPase, partial [candidate division Zixibacteria bacterium]|nr:AAA family ATPase [candidate division Zixibacteria bacterium]